MITIFNPLIGSVFAGIFVLWIARRPVLSALGWLVDNLDPDEPDEYQRLSEGPDLDAQDTIENRYRRSAE